MSMKITSLLAVAILAVTSSAGSVTTYCDSQPNSVGLVAQCGYTGSLVREANQLSMTLTGATSQSFGQLTCGTIPFNVPFGNGTLCINPLSQFVRVGGPVPIVNGQAICPVDLPSMPYATTLRFQWWYRDTQAGAITFNTSNAVACTLD
jgi:hypothetical protein